MTSPKRRRRIVGKDNEAQKDERKKVGRNIDINESVNEKKKKRELSTSSDVSC